MSINQRPATAWTGLIFLSNWFLETHFRESLIEIKENMFSVKDSFENADCAISVKRLHPNQARLNAYTPQPPPAATILTKLGQQEMDQLLIRSLPFSMLTRN